MGGTEKICATVRLPIYERTSRNKALRNFQLSGRGTIKSTQQSDRQVWLDRLGAAARAALTVLYPWRCLNCAICLPADHAFCLACQGWIQVIHSPLCTRCGRPFASRVGPDHICPQCVQQPPSFRHARAWAAYSTPSGSPQPLRQSILRFKYGRNMRAGKALAGLTVHYFSLAQEQSAGHAADYDRVIPVPLHLTRLRWRGFNQSLILARAIGQHINTPVDPWLLSRTRPTSPQTKLSREERRANVRGAFRMNTPALAKGKRFLLVDDVYTSGATVEECARTLYQNEARSVDVFTLARVVDL